MPYRAGAYDTCLHCEHLGIQCDGPNVLAMALERWCEWCKDLKSLRGLTNTQIAERSGVSEPTIIRIMNGMVSKDIMMSTASAINKVLVGTAGQYPCAQAAGVNADEFNLELATRDETIRRLQETLDKIHESYKLEMQEIRESYRRELDVARSEAQTKIEFLRLENDRKNKIIEQLLSK